MSVCVLQNSHFLRYVAVTTNSPCTGLNHVGIDDFRNTTQPTTAAGAHCDVDFEQLPQLREFQFDVTVFFWIELGESSF